MSQLDALKNVSEAVIIHQQCSPKIEGLIIEKEKLTKQLAQKSTELEKREQENQEFIEFIATCTQSLENSTESVRLAQEQLVQKSIQLEEMKKVATKLKQLSEGTIRKNDEISEKLDLIQAVEIKHVELVSEIEDNVAVKDRVVQLEERIVQLEEESKAQTKRIVHLEEMLFANENRNTDEMKKLTERLSKLEYHHG